MNPNQEIIDYLNSENDKINNLISDKNQEKDQIDLAIMQQQSNIDYFNNQKNQCDIQIAAYNDSISKNNQIIVILSS